MPNQNDFVVEQILVNGIFPVGQRRSINEETTKALCDSIETIGLQVPITVRVDETIPDPDTGEAMGGFALISGQHRLEAYRRLGYSKIPAIVRDDWDEADARLWELAENLHRADLTALERSEYTAEWIRLTDEKRHSAQNAPIETKRQDGKGHRRESGINAAARELGIERTDAQRAVKVASLSNEAKQFARESELHNNRSALLKAASHRTPTRQIETLRSIQRNKQEREWQRREGELKAARQRGKDAAIRAATLLAELAGDRLPELWDHLEDANMSDFQRVVGWMAIGKSIEEAIALSSLWPTRPPSSD